MNQPGDGFTALCTNFEDVVVKGFYTLRSWKARLWTTLGTREMAAIQITICEFTSPGTHAEEDVRSRS